MMRGMAASARRSWRYWSLFLRAANGAVALAISEVELRAVAGGADLTTSSTPVTATSTSGGSVAASTVDNSTSTYWIGATSTNQRLIFDMAAAVAVRQVAIYQHLAATYGPSSFVIQGSNDGSTWVDLLDLTGITWTAGSWRTFDL